jgi:membrane peptidoglycan carboxypeptidase
VWLGNDDYTQMNESYGGNVPARIWARFMKAALAGTPPHDFTVPTDEIAKSAGCGGGYEYYLRGTEPSCGSVEDASNGEAAPYATLDPRTTEAPLPSLAPIDRATEAPQASPSP